MCAWGCGGGERTVQREGLLSHVEKQERFDGTESMKMTIGRYKWNSPDKEGDFTGLDTFWE